MAPEVLLGDYDAKVDEYAAGVIFYNIFGDNKFPFVSCELLEK
jgi:hypothetical protein